jgi:arylsulfatase A-like enzyme
MRCARRSTMGPAAWLLTAGLLAAAGCGSGAGGAPPVPHFRNLVVVLVDSLRSDHLPSYGYARNTAPHLARLADQGIQLQGYAASSWTRPAVATLLTGLAPPRHGAFGRWDRFVAELPYLPVILEKAGWRTAAVVGNGNVGNVFGFGRGYAEFIAFDKAKPRAAEVITRAIETIPHLTTPFYLYVHLVDPHGPYRPAKPWESLGRASASPPPPLPRPNDSLPSPARLQYMRDLYDGEIAEMDPQIGRLLDALDAAGALDDTLVVVTADHGEEFGEHGGLAHGRTLFEESIQVPFVVWAKSGLRPYESTEPFHHVDFVPTVLEALGLPAPMGLDGRSRWREVVTRHFGPPRPLFFHLDLAQDAVLAVFEPPYKLVLGTHPPALLFDLARDGAERLDLGREPAERARLSRALLEWTVTESARRPAQEIADLPPAVVDRLAALGYAERGPSGNRSIDLTRSADVHAALDPRRPGVQILAGFVAPDADGAWIGPFARFVLAAGPDARAIHLTGTALASAECTVRVDDHDAAPTRVTNGPVDLRVPIPADARGRPVVFVDLTVKPASFAPGVPMPVGFHWNRFEAVGAEGPPPSG